MTIEIDLELLKTTNLSPNEFIGLYLVFRKGYTYLDELNLNINWKKLLTKEYVLSVDLSFAMMISKQSIFKVEINCR